MSGPAATPSRRDVLLELAYRHVLAHGLADMSLRPLAAAVGSSPRVLLFLFGTKDDLIRALLARARQEELALLAATGQPPAGGGLAEAATRLWQWLSAPEHRDLLRFWVEAYARSLVDPAGPWAGFARQTVRDWLDFLADLQPGDDRTSPVRIIQRTELLAVLRGALLDLLASNDTERTTAAVHRAIAALQPAASSHNRSPIR